MHTHEDGTVRTQDHSAEPSEKKKNSWRNKLANLPTSIKEWGQRAYQIFKQDIQNVFRWIKSRFARGPE